MFLCFVLFCCLPATASPRLDGPAQERFDVWTTENGLPQNSVNAIVQTRDGYLWLATMDGLARFDGVRFTVFNRANTQGIKSNRLTALCEDGEGGLWIGTEDSGVIRYKDGVFTTYTTAEGLPGDQVYEIHFAPESLLLVHTGKGVVRWDGAQFVPYTADNERFTRLQDGPSTVDDEGGLWTNDSSGFYRWTPAGGVAFYPVRGGLPESVLIYATYRDRRGVIWLGAAGAGVFKLQGSELIAPRRGSSPARRERSLRRPRRADVACHRQWATPLCERSRHHPHHCARAVGR